MAKTKISEFSSTPASNTDIDSINIAEGCAPSGINDAIRELMSQLKDWQSGTSNDPYVVGSSGSLTLNQGTANGVAYLNGSKVVTSGSALTYNGTGLGIGVSSASNPLHIDFDGTAARIVRGSAVGFVYNTGTGSTDSFRIQSNAGPVDIYTASGQPITFSASASEQMRLTSTGLGIGTSSLYSGTKLTIQESASNPGGIAIRNRNSTQTWQFSVDAAAVDDKILAFIDPGAGVVRMALDSSGNLGLGVTPSAWQTTNSIRALEFNVGSIAGYSTTEFNFSQNAYYSTGNTWVYKNTAASTQYRQTAGAHSWYNAPSGTAGNAITFTQAMTLDASGNLALGTTTATGQASDNRVIQIYGAGTNNRAQIHLCNSDTGQTSTDGSFIGVDTTGALYVVNRENAATIFENNGAERARIDSSGMLAVNYTSTISGGLLVVSSNGVKQSLLVKNDDSVKLYSLGTGTVYSNAGVLTSTNPSDARLKTDVQDLNWGLSQVLALRPVSYAWKNNQINQGTQYGFIAQEVQTVMPDLVREFETKDGEETVTRFGLEKDGIYAAMVKAIQEMKSIIDDQAARIATLEAK
jgi:hypothetical protein